MGHELSIFHVLAEALHHTRIGLKVALLKPPKAVARPPKKAIRKCEIQLEILAALRFRELQCRKGDLTRTRVYFAEIAKYYVLHDPRLGADSASHLAIR